MHAMVHDITIPEREERADGARTVMYTTLYDLIAAVNDAIEPSEEGCVTPIVAHLLRAGHARFLREANVEMLWAEPAPASLLAEERCVLA